MLHSASLLAYITSHHNDQNRFLLFFLFSSLGEELNGSLRAFPEWPQHPLLIRCWKRLLLSGFMPRLPFKASSASNKPHIDSPLQTGAKRGLMACESGADNERTLCTGSFPGCNALRACHEHNVTLNSPDVNKTAPFPLSLTMTLENLLLQTPITGSRLLCGVFLFYFILKIVEKRVKS